MADKAYNKFVLRENGVEKILLDLSQYPNMTPENVLKGIKFINYLGVEVEGIYETEYYNGEWEIIDGE